MPGLVLSPDADSVPELAEDRAVHWDRISAANFLSDEQKRILLGLEGELAGLAKNGETA